MLNVWHRWKDYTVPDAYFDVALSTRPSATACAVFDLITDDEAPRHRSGRAAVSQSPALLAMSSQDQARQGRLLRLVRRQRPGHRRRHHLPSARRRLSTVLAGAAARLAARAPRMDSMCRSSRTARRCRARASGPTSCAVLKAHRLQGVEQLAPFSIGYFAVRRRRADGLAHGVHGRSRLRIVDRALARARSVGRVVRQGRASTASARWARMRWRSPHRSRLHPGARRFPAGRSGDPPRSHALAVRARPRRLVDLTKPNFNGRRALLEEQKRGSRYRLCGWTSKATSRHARRTSTTRARNGNVIGTVTSAQWSPSAKANIALGCSSSALGSWAMSSGPTSTTRKRAQMERRMAPCCVVEGAFYTPARRRQLAAPRRSQ